ncbi:SIS domain-containing protein [Selenomonas ruminantium]|uniref:SIS domain-containing protein n=1 Tax=Selenomonas ruminantium TaxID=971 RepID=UPI00041AB96D|nr:SIS domain-containing protein [Selenomonas ruminantium]
MKSYIQRLIEKLRATEFLQGCQTCSSYEDGVQLLVNAFTKYKQAGSQIFFIGNGGSAAIASHMTADFMKNGGMNTYSLYDNAVMTCMSNDYGYENIFSRPLAFWAKQGDLLVAISSSGNSSNIISAIDTVKEKKGFVITFTGFDSDNKAKQKGDINVYVPCNKYGIVESIHTIILQQVVDTILERDGAKF